MFCISISYKRAGAEFRKRFAFTPEVQRIILSELMNSSDISQCILLCTCNRTELYYCGNENSYPIAQNIFAKYGKTDIERLMPYLMSFNGENAIYHLFKVTCGLDSMVIGEDEILGQAKSAYALSKELGAADYELNMIFQSAFACAKKIKTQTMLSKTSVSVATLAANEAVRLGKNANIFIIGATGKIGSTVLKNLLSHKNLNVIAASRRHNSEFDFLKNNSQIKTVDYARRYEYIDNADCVISATSSPHYTITLYDFKKNIKRNKKRLYIDLAVPPDIDKCITEIKDARLINIDYFEQLAKENNLLKIESVESAKNIIAAEVDVLKKDLLFRKFLPYLENVKDYLSSVSVETILYKLKAQISAEQFSAVLDVLKGCTGQV